MSTKPNYYVFPNGTSHMIWRERNCDNCWKRATEKTCGRNPRCAIETAISLGACTDGSLLHDGTTSEKKAASIAARLNWDGHGYLTNDCPERQEKRPESKEERVARLRKDQPEFNLS